MTPRLVLVGAPGAGKTTVGERLATRLDTTFHDTDANVERRSGQPIAAIFVDAGEAAFRALEREAVLDTLRDEEGVVALGSGAVLDAQVRALLEDMLVVFLDVGLAEAARRTGLARERPVSLGNPRAQLRQLLDARRPLYAEVATITVVTDGRTPDEVADEVAANLEPGRR